MHLIHSFCIQHIVATFSSVVPRREQVKRKGGCLDTHKLLCLKRSEKNPQWRLQCLLFVDHRRRQDVGLSLFCGSQLALET